MNVNLVDLRQIPSPNCWQSGSINRRFYLALCIHISSSSRRDRHERPFVTENFRLDEFRQRTGSWDRAARSRPIVDGEKAFQKLRKKSEKAQTQSGMSRLYLRLKPSSI